MGCGMRNVNTVSHTHTHIILVLTAPLDCNASTPYAFTPTLKAVLRVVRAWHGISMVTKVSWIFLIGSPRHYGDERGPEQRGPSVTSVSLSLSAYSVPEQQQDTLETDLDTRCRLVAGRKGPHFINSFFKFDIF